MSDHEMDGKLVALAKEFAAIEEEHNRLGRSGDDLKDDSPEAIALDRLCERVSARSKELLDTIFATPATTSQGLAAKATIGAKLVSRDIKGEPLWRDRPLNSLVSDILTQTAKPAELDVDLLAAAAEFHSLRAAEKAFWLAVEEGRERASWNDCDRPGGLWDQIKDATKRVATTTAKTPAGLRAKASVAKALLLEHHGPQAEEGCAGEEIDVALSLVRDLLGRASA